MAWRRSNHLRGAFNGDVYAVTPHGWGGYLDHRAGYRALPRRRLTVCASTVGGRRYVRLMAPEPSMLELLRSRLADLEARQRAAGGASEAWVLGALRWAYAVTSVRARRLDRAPGEGSSTRRAPGWRRSHGRSPRAHGPWSELSAESLDSLDLDALKPLSEAEWHEMVNDPAWIEATARASGRAQGRLRTTATVSRRSRSTRSRGSPSTGTRAPISPPRQSRSPTSGATTRSRWSTSSPSSSPGASRL